MFYKAEFATAHLIALGASALLLLAAWKLPRVGRLLYAALFVWASAVNWTTALHRPTAYLEYAPLAVSAVYRHIILGPFARHLLLAVGTVATCQGLIALGLLFGGRGARIALCGAIAFLVAIAPLGVGSGFPSTLLMAAGALLLLRERRAVDGPVLRAVLRPLFRRPFGRP